MSSKLFRAIEQLDVNRVASLLEQGVDPNRPLNDPPGWRPLEAIIEEGVHNDAAPDAVLGIVRLLLHHGAEVNFSYDDRKLTPLLAAMHFPDMRLARMLVEEGADPNVFDAYGFSPLMMTVRNSDVDLASVLLHYGAAKSVNEYDPQVGFGALYSALRRLSYPMVKLLLDAGASPHSPTLDGDTPMSGMPPRNKENAQQWDAISALLAERKRKLLPR